ncbi:ThiF family adenylyltransferase [Shouchella shacheensis]|uniref:ThiF family adenylyltransferase n=1 Tax=Shouchella shacheensis TaxID=1649580 RepID=UPI0007401A60|nr:ThiF family adenylyltransferase [Shouchella shacheensis]
MERERYSRQMLFSGIGEAGQELLAEKRVLIVGVGALGTVLANHMVRAGVGHVRLVDRDYVEASNLQRQMLFDEHDVQAVAPKAIAAKEKLEKVNSSIHIEALVEDVTTENIERLMEGVDLVLDGTDNFNTRFLLNDACFKWARPFGYGGAVSARGMNALFVPGETPCLRCFISSGNTQGETCDTVGVIAPIVDIVASYQSVEALKYFVEAKDKLTRSLKTVDIWHNHAYNLAFKEPKKDCPTCQMQEYPALRQEEEAATTLCGRETVQIRGNQRLDLKKWAKRLTQVADVHETPFLVRVLLSEGERLVLFADGRVLIQGTEDLTRARTLYSKYIGD